LAKGPATSAELNVALKPFTGDDPRALAPVIDALTRRGWIRAEADGRHALTADGAAAHQRIRQDVDQTRRLILRYVTTEEYAHVIDILQRMAAGLESAGLPPELRRNGQVGDACLRAGCWLRSAW